METLDQERVWSLDGAKVKEGTEESLLQYRSFPWRKMELFRGEREIQTMNWLLFQSFFALSAQLSRNAYKGETRDLLKTKKATRMDGDLTFAIIHPVSPFSLTISNGAITIVSWFLCDLPLDRSWRRLRRDRVRSEGSPWISCQRESIFRGQSSRNRLEKRKTVISLHG